MAASDARSGRCGSGGSSCQPSSTASSPCRRRMGEQAFGRGALAQGTLRPFSKEQRRACGLSSMSRQMARSFTATIKPTLSFDCFTRRCMSMRAMWTRLELASKPCGQLQAQRPGRIAAVFFLHEAPMLQARQLAVQRTAPAAPWRRRAAARSRARSIAPRWPGPSRTRSWDAEDCVSVDMMALVSGSGRCSAKQVIPDRWECPGLSSDVCGG